MQLKYLFNFLHHLLFSFHQHVLSLFTIHFIFIHISNNLAKLFFFSDSFLRNLMMKNAKRSVSIWKRIVGFQKNEDEVITLFSGLLSFRKFRL